MTAGTKAGKAKILRKVQFPRVLDIYEFCSDQLKKNLDEGREMERQQREITDGASKAGKDVEMKDANEEEKEARKAVGKQAKIEEKLR